MNYLSKRMRQYSRITILIICLLSFMGAGELSNLQAQTKHSKEWKKAERKKRKEAKRIEKQQRKLARKARNEAAKRRPDKRSRKRNSDSAVSKRKRKSKIRSNNNFVKEAMKYQTVPYRYGGESPTKGFDCSGYVQYVYQKNGVDLPRTAAQQSKQGVAVKKSKLESGDLIFFGSGGKINHVGIVVSDKGKPLSMIHSGSSTGVTITNVEESNYWSKRFRKARRIR